MDAVFQDEKTTFEEKSQYIDNAPQLPPENSVYIKTSFEKQDQVIMLRNHHSRQNLYQFIFILYKLKDINVFLIRYRKETKTLRE